MLEAGAVEFDELADNTLLTQPLGDGEHEIGGGDALAQLPAQANTDDVGHQHRDRLPQHRRLGLDAPHTPADDAQAIDHRRVRVGPHQRVGVRHGSTVDRRAAHNARQVLEIDLVDDPGVGRDDPKVLERVLSPPQERIPLEIPGELEVGIQLQRVRTAKMIDLDRMVDDELDRLQRIDAARIATQSQHTIPHRREIDQRRHAREILQQDAGRREGDLMCRRTGRVPAGHDRDVVRADGSAVLVPQQILEQDLEGIRQACDIPDARALERRQTVELDRLVADPKIFKRVERVRHESCPRVSRLRSSLALPRSAAPRESSHIPRCCRWSASRRPGRRRRPAAPDTRPPGAAGAPE